MKDERPIEDRPPWEPKSRVQIEKEMSELQARNHKLGDSLAWIVDTLLQDESETKDVQRRQRQKRAALESLAYVRDVLLTGSTTIEEERLVSEEEAKQRRKNALEKRKPLTVTAPSAPDPLPVADSQTSITRSSSGHTITPQQPHSPPKIPTKAVPFNPLPAPVATPSPSPAQRAPWSYTPFGSSSLPSAMLPRPPPPTSTSFRRSPDPVLKEFPKEKPPPLQKSQTPNDPLGVS